MVHGMSGVVTEEELDDVAHVIKEHISDVSCTVAMTDVCLQTPAASAAGSANHQVDDTWSNLLAMTDVCLQVPAASGG